MESKWTLILLIIATIIVVIADSSSAQWPDCGFQCNAGDLKVKDIWLGDSQGNSLPPCRSGSQIIANIWASFENNANSPRYAVILLADIYVDGILRESFYDQGLCVLDSIPPKAARSYPIYSLSWSCGQKVEIKRLILSWETAKGANCANAKRKCSNRNTKCSGSPGNEVQVSLPLAAAFESYGSKCCCDEIGFLDRTTGGLRPYAYSWGFGDGSDNSSLQNPLHGYNMPGQYDITLRVIDSEGSSAGITKKISILSSPSADAGPDLSIRPGGSVRLEGSASASRDASSYSLSWSPDQFLDDPSSLKPLASPKKTTIYSLDVEDAQGCRNSDNMTLFISSIDITKSILNNPVEVGREAIYNYRIENQGDSDLKNISVIDSKFGEVSGPLQGDENRDGLLNAGEAWIYRIVFRPKFNSTSSARVSAIDPVGAALYAESAEIAVNVTSSQQSVQCEIQGSNIVCEDATAAYVPQLKGEDPVAFNLTWRIDGIEIEEASNNDEIQVPWSLYGGGYHALQLTANRAGGDQKGSEEGKKDQTVVCELNVLVVEVPNATIEMDGG